MAAALAAVFLLFNIGLPIVVASCPMSKTKAPVCGVCTDGPSDGQKITTWKNTSCCTVIIAAEKSSAEYLQSKFSSPSIEGCARIVVATAQFDSFSGYLSNSELDRSPDLVFDIPILTSSLLI
jgi:hypothetical protein